MQRKSVKKKVITMLMSMVLSLSCVINVYASDVLTYNGDTGKIVTNEDANLIEEKIAEISSLKLKIKSIEELHENQDYNGESTLETEITVLQEKIKNLEEELKDLGAETSFEKIAQDIGVSNIVDTTDTGLCSTYARSVWHPSRIVEQYEGAYDIYGYVTYDENNNQQYHIVFSSKDGEDPYLLQTSGDQAVVIKGAFSQGSTDAQGWIDNCIKFGIEKMVGSYLGDYGVILEILPWESMFNYKPSAKLVRATTNATTISSINVASHIKFVFVYNEKDDMWEYALSTSKAYMSYTITNTIYHNGKFYNNSPDYNAIYIPGSYDTAISDATNAFNYNTTKNTCLANWSIKYDRDNNGIEETVFEFDLHTPNNVAGMIY